MVQWNQERAPAVGQAVDVADARAGVAPGGALAARVQALRVVAARVEARVAAGAAPAAGVGHREQRVAVSRRVQRIEGEGAVLEALQRGGTLLSCPGRADGRVEGRLWAAGAAQARAAAGTHLADRAGSRAGWERGGGGARLGVVQVGAAHELLLRPADADAGRRLDARVAAAPPVRAHHEEGGQRDLRDTTCRPSAGVLGAQGAE